MDKNLSPLPQRRAREAAAVRPKESGLTRIDRDSFPFRSPVSKPFGDGHGILLPRLFTCALLFVCALLFAEEPAVEEEPTWRSSRGFAVHASAAVSTAP